MIHHRLNAHTLKHRNIVLSKRMLFKELPQTVCLINIVYLELEQNIEYASCSDKDPGTCSLWLPWLFRLDQVPFDIYCHHNGLTVLPQWKRYLLFHIHKLNLRDSVQNPGSTHPSPTTGTRCSKLPLCSFPRVGAVMHVHQLQTSGQEFCLGETMENTCGDVWFVVGSDESFSLETYLCPGSHFNTVRVIRF